MGRPYTGDTVLQRLAQLEEEESELKTKNEKLETKISETKNEQEWWQVAAELDAVRARLEAINLEAQTICENNPPDLTSQDQNLAV